MTPYEAIVSQEKFWDGQEKQQKLWIHQMLMHLTREN